MPSLTPLHCAILEALDTAEHGAGDNEIQGELLFGNTCISVTDRIDTDAILAAIVQLLDEGLIDARFRENPRDLGVTADPIIYSLSDAGADALWALMRAEVIKRIEAWALQVTVPAFVQFADRNAMREYLRGAA